MERLTVSSSLRFKEEVNKVISDLAEYGVVAVFPNLETGVKKEDVDLEYMRELEKAHFESIDESEGLYVICPGGYVGTLVSVEIGYAVAQGKPVIFSEEPEDLGLQAVASGYVSMDELIELKNV